MIYYNTEVCMYIVLTMYIQCLTLNVFGANSFDNVLFLDLFD